MSFRLEKDRVYSKAELKEAKRAAELLNEVEDIVRASEHTEAINESMEAFVRLRKPQFDLKAAQQLVVSVTSKAKTQAPLVAGLLSGSRELASRMEANLTVSESNMKLLEENSEYRRRLGIDFLPRWLDRAIYKAGQTLRQSSLRLLLPVLLLSFVLFAVSKGFLGASVGVLWDRLMAGPKSVFLFPKNHLVMVGVLLTVVLILLLFLGIS